MARSLGKASHWLPEGRGPAARAGSRDDVLEPRDEADEERRLEASWSDCRAGMMLSFGLWYGGLRWLTCHEKFRTGR